MAGSNGSISFSFVEEELNKKKLKTVILDKKSEEYKEAWSEIVTYIKVVIKRLEGQEKRKMLFELIYAYVEADEIELAHETLDELNRTKGSE